MEGTPDRRIQACSAVLQSLPQASTADLVRAAISRGGAFTAIGDPARAIADYTAALRLDPRASRAFNGRGLAYWRAGYLERAIADYTVALYLDPTFSHAFYNRGSAHYARAENDLAFADYNAALRIDPRYAHAYAGRGLVYHRLGDDDRAIADYTRALTYRPNFRRALTNRAVALKDKGAYDAALNDLRDALRLDPNNAYTFAVLGTVEDARGDHATALAAYRQALRLDPRVQDRSADLAAPSVQPSGRPTGAGSQPIERIMAEGDNDSDDPSHVPLPSQSAPVERPAAPEKRIALVIGNAHYASVGLLPNPLNDARDVAKTLRAAGFTVIEKDDLSREQLIDALGAFAGEAATADWAIVYYSGHGMEMAGVNYLVPVDARLSTDNAVQFEAVPLGQVMGAVDGAHKLRLIILDACRSNPFASRMTLASASRAPSRGLARPPEPDPGELIVYAARDGEVASDGKGSNSPFTEALIKEIQTPRVDIRRVFDDVRDDVIETTGRTQHPFTYGSLPGHQDFFFQARQ
jgi:tetratricopeptide (TPR) repeat protein